jgi:SAM-dependent methyltransferase
MAPGSPSEAIAANVAQWTANNRSYADAAAAAAWVADDISWGIFAVDDAALGSPLGEVGERDIVELGCGTAYFSAWLARRGARPVGVDPTPAQLATARRLQGETGIRFPLIEAPAESVPLPDDSFDIAFSEYGASLWADPELWVPEAARLLRPGGRLVFLTTSVLVYLCLPDQGPAGTTLQRSQFGMSRIGWPNEVGIEFNLPHGEWLRLLRRHGFEALDLIEVQAPADAVTHTTYDHVTPEWAHRWPAEEIWVAQLVGRPEPKDDGPASTDGPVVHRGSGRELERLDDGHGLRDPGGLVRRVGRVEDDEHRLPIEIEEDDSPGITRPREGIPRPAIRVPLTRGLEGQRIGEERELRSGIEARGGRVDRDVGVDIEVEHGGRVTVDGHRRWVAHDGQVRLGGQPADEPIDRATGTGIERGVAVLVEVRQGGCGPGGDPECVRTSGGPGRLASVALRRGELIAVEAIEVVGPTLGDLEAERAQPGQRVCIRTPPRSEQARLESAGWKVARAVPVLDVTVADPSPLAAEVLRAWRTAFFHRLDGDAGIADRSGPVVDPH